ncbi:flippase [Sphingomonas sp. PB1R3]|uniref:flippase n=1 Tax=Sphingomonas flavida TaxID=3096154 RepID=UPI002FC96BEE
MSTLDEETGGTPTGLAAQLARLRPSALRAMFMERAVLRSLITNASWLVADRVVRLGVGLFINIWIARYLGPTKFGLFNYAQAIATMFSFASTLGLPEILMRDLVGWPDRKRLILASAFILRVGGAVIVLILSMVFIVGTRPTEPSTWLIMAFLASAQIAQAMDVVDSEYQSAGKVSRIVLLRNLNFLFFSVVKVVAILMGAGVITFALLYSLELFIVALLMYIVAIHDGYGFSISDAKTEEMRRLFREVAPQILRLAIIGVYMRADQLLIGQFLGDTEVGIYTAATRLIEAWYLVITAVMLAATPRLAHTFHFNRERYDAALTLVVRVLVWGSVAVALVVTAVAPTAVRILYGNAFVAAGPVLMVHAWATVFSSLGQAVSGALVNRRLLHIGVYQALVGAAVNVGACLVLIPLLGVIGAALAAVMTQVATGLLLNACFRETRPILRVQLRAIFFR